MLFVLFMSGCVTKPKVIWTDGPPMIPVVYSYPLEVPDYHLGTCPFITGR